jgi:pyruvate formate lyase activating enzyme
MIAHAFLATDGPASRFSPAPRRGRPAFPDLPEREVRTPLGQAWARLRGIEPLSLCDWPGRTTSVLFFSGCNLACPTCQNAALAFDGESLPPVSRSRAMIHLGERGRWLDGVVVSGGEPTMVPGLPDLLADLARFGLPVKVDTNGMRPAVVREILDLGLAEVFAVDVKGPFGLYPELTGGGTTAQAARESLSEIFELAAAHPRAFYFRITAVPALCARDIDEARRLLPPGFPLAVQEYKPPRRTHAQTHSETRRKAGDLVHGPHRPGHPEGPGRQRHQGPAAGPAAGAESRIQA